MQSGFFLFSLAHQQFVIAFLSHYFNLVLVREWVGEVPYLVRLQSVVSAGPPRGDDHLPRHASDGRLAEKVLVTGHVH
jgi:hypothetical protein